jgi:hypothetical protein
MSVFLQPIYTQTIGAGGASSVTFNNIPQGFTDLQIVISGRTDFANVQGGIYMYLNGNANSNYSGTFLTGNGSAASSARQNSNIGIFIGECSAANATSGTFSSHEIKITNYNNGYPKSIYTLAVAENNATAAVMSTNAGLSWLTLPVTSLTITSFGYGNFVQYSTFTLYGISNVYDTATPTAPTIGTVTDQAGFASVAFTPASNDRADSYVVTSTPSGSTTYGGASPIVTPAVLDTSYTYQVASVNSLGSASSSASSALTTFNNYTAIATASAPSGSAANFTFANVPQNYKHLQIRLFIRSTNTAGSYGTMYTGFNGDTFSGNNYWNHYIIGDGSSAFLNGAVGQQVNVSPVPWSSVTSGSFCSIIIDLFDYADASKYKVVKYLTGWDSNNGSRAAIGSAVWMNFQPISNIYMTPDGGFAQYSHAALYGIS